MCLTLNNSSLSTPNEKDTGKDGSLLPDFYDTVQRALGVESRLLRLMRRTNELVTSVHGLLSSAS